jgi:hypothetical protein
LAALSSRQNNGRHPYPAYEGKMMDWRNRRWLPAGLAASAEQRRASWRSVGPQCA